MLRKLGFFVFLSFAAKPLIAAAVVEGDISGGIAPTDTVTASAVACADCVDGSDLADTITLDAALTLNAGSVTVRGDVLLASAAVVNGNLTAGDETGDVFTVNADSVTFALDTNVSLQGGVNGLKFGRSGTFTTLSLDAATGLGRVGIGKQTPGFALDVLTNTSFDGIQLVGTDDHVVLTLDNTDTGGRYWQNVVSGGSSGYGANKWILIHEDRGNLAAWDGATGFYGIGNIAPNTKLHLSSGTLQIDGNVSPSISSNQPLSITSVNTSTFSGTIDVSTLTVDNISISTFSQIIVSTGNGHGSTDNKIRRFTTTIQSVGTDIVMSSTAANGNIFTIQRDGFYAAEFCDALSSGATYLGISVNSGLLTTSINTVSVENGRRSIQTTISGSNSACASATLRLSAGDIVRAHTAGDSDATAACFFTITRIH